MVKTKFIKQKNLLKKTKQAGNFIQKNWNKLTQEKKRTTNFSMWNGIIPKDLPIHLTPFKKTLQELATRGSEGPAWDKVINDTKLFIADSKIMNEKELLTKHKKFLKQLSEINYDEYDWMTTDDLLFNIDAKRAITNLDLEFIEKRILPDLENSKQRAWQRHCKKWGYEPK